MTPAWSAARCGRSSRRVARYGSKASVVRPALAGRVDCAPFHEPKTNRRPRGTADRFYRCQPRLARRTRILEDRAEQFPALAVELHHLQLLVDAIVGRCGGG